MRTESGLAVPMRDGVVLRADAYLPDGDEPVPAILSRTPYDRSFRLTPVAAVDPERATEAGFALVVQDVRGLGDSEGEFRAVRLRGARRLRHGRVGRRPALVQRTRGDGRPLLPAGATQWRARAPSSRRTCGRSARWWRATTTSTTGSTSGGAFELGFNLFWVHLMTESEGAGARSTSTTAHLPLTEPPLLAGNPAAELLPRVARPPDLRRALAGALAPRALRPRAGAGAQRGRLVRRLPRRARSRTSSACASRGLGARPVRHAPDRRPVGARQRLRRMAGPPLQGVRAPGTRSISPRCGLEFFGRHLREDPADEDEPPVRIFVMGENVWRDEREWPLARARRRSAGSCEPTARWRPDPPESEAPDEYVYDPRDPAPTIGGPTSLPGQVHAPRTPARSTRRRSRGGRTCCCTARSRWSSRSR